MGKPCGNHRDGRSLVLIPRLGHNQSFTALVETLDKWLLFLNPFQIDLRKYTKKHNKLFFNHYINIYVINSRSPQVKGNLIMKTLFIILTLLLSVPIYSQEINNPRPSSTLKAISIDFKNFAKY